MNEALERLRRVQYIGRQTAKLLYEEKGIEGIEGLLEFSKDELKGISGIGEHKAEEILKSAERLTESLERCDICGFYSERDQECPYCKDKNRSINGRSEDSIVDTFIQSKNGRKFSVEKDKAFYN
ncbi:MAG: helix-hairpin-helix domain-containing protein, partial [Candidatus Saliniplasma sp.]